jgi:ribonuclease T2
MRMKAIAGLSVLLLLGLIQPVAARELCRLPDRITVAPCDRREESRGRPGEFDFYILSFSWSPAFCAGPAGRRATLQCRDNSFGWIVHGLWPQYAERRAKQDNGGQRWPQYCAPVQPVPETVLRRHLCSSPDPRLMQCEWAKHGSCSDFDSPAAYFAAQDAAAGRFVLPAPQPGQSVRAYTGALLAANDGTGMKSGHLRVVGDGTAGIREVRICLARDLSQTRPC